MEYVTTRPEHKQQAALAALVLGLQTRQHNASTYWRRSGHWLLHLREGPYSKLLERQLHTTKTKPCELQTVFFCPFPLFGLWPPCVWDLRFVLSHSRDVGKQDLACKWVQSSQSSQIALQLYINILNKAQWALWLYVIKTSDPSTLNWWTGFAARPHGCPMFPPSISWTWPETAALAIVRRQNLE